MTPDDPRIHWVTRPYDGHPAWKPRGSGGSPLLVWAVGLAALIVMCWLVGR